MVDLNKIRSMNTLENMKKDLLFFINEPVIQQIYKEEYNWGEEDYDADKESAKDLLEKIEKRMKSLSKYLSKEKNTTESS